MSYDPVDIHDELSKGFARIENVIREETAKMSEIIRQAVVQKDTYVYKPTAPSIYWPNNYIPEACRSCANHPSNGGTGICHCILGSPSITSGVVWREEDLNLQPSSFTTTASTDCPWKGER